MIHQEQIIGVLKQHETDRAITEPVRESGGQRGDDLNLGGRDTAGMEVSETQRLKSLDYENRSQKQLVTDLSLDKEALKAIVQKNEILSYSRMRKPKQVRARRTSSSSRRRLLQSIKEDIHSSRGTLIFPPCPRNDPETPRR
jgi:putative transposase